VNLIPIDATIKKIIWVVAILVIVLWVISALFPGTLPHVPLK